MASRRQLARDLANIKNARLRAQTPGLGASSKARFKPTMANIKNGLWSRSAPGGNDPPRPGWQMGKTVAQKRITLARVSILED